MAMTAADGKYISGRLYAELNGASACTISYSYLRKSLSTFVAVSPESNTNPGIPFIYHHSDNNLYSEISTNRLTSKTCNVTGQHCAVLVFNGAIETNLKLFVYFDGIKGVIAPTGTALPVSLSNNLSEYDINIGKYKTIATTQDYADVAVWSSVLTDAEINSLAKGFKPSRIRPQSLVFYAPLVRAVQDVRKGITLTPVNSPTVADIHESTDMALYYQLPNKLDFF